MLGTSDCRDIEFKHLVCAQETLVRSFSNPVTFRAVALRTIVFGHTCLILARQCLLRTGLLPNRRMAARIVEYNASGLGGAEDSVKLFTAHGLSSDVVFFGEFNLVKARN